MNFQIKKVERKDIKLFIEIWHYSKNINGCISNYCFGLYDEDQLIGAMFYGRLAMANQWKKYVVNEKDIIELRRLCCIDNTPKNTESYFIGATLRWLKKNTDIKKVISYVDSNYGHTGIIYKANNFSYKGLTSPGKIILLGNKKYYDKAIRTKYKGKLKPFAVNLKNQILLGNAKIIKQKRKYIYIYTLRT